MSLFGSALHVGSFQRMVKFDEVGAATSRVCDELGNDDIYLACLVEIVDMKEANWRLSSKLIVLKSELR